MIYRYFLDHHVYKKIIFLICFCLTPLFGLFGMDEFKRLEEQFADTKTEETAEETAEETEDVSSLLEAYHKDLSLPQEHPDWQEELALHNAMEALRTNVSLRRVVRNLEALEMSDEQFCSFVRKFSCEDVEKRLLFVAGLRDKREYRDFAHGLLEHQNKEQVFNFLKEMKVFQKKNDLVAAMEADLASGTNAIPLPFADAKSFAHIHKSSRYQDFLDELIVPDWKIKDVHQFLERLAAAGRQDVLGGRQGEFLDAFCRAGGLAVADQAPEELETFEQLKAFLRQLPDKPPVRDAFDRMHQNVLRNREIEAVYNSLRELSLGQQKRFLDRFCPVNSGLIGLMKSMKKMSGSSGDSEDDGENEEPGLAQRLGQFKPSLRDYSNEDALQDALARMSAGIDDLSRSDLSDEDELDDDVDVEEIVDDLEGDLEEAADFVIKPLEAIAESAEDVREERDEEDPAELVEGDTEARRDKVKNKNKLLFKVKVKSAKDEKKGDRYLTFTKYDTARLALLLSQFVGDIFFYKKFFADDSARMLEKLKRHSTELLPILEDVREDPGSVVFLKKEVTRGWLDRLISPITSLLTKQPPKVVALNKFLSRNIAPNFFQLRKLFWFALKFALDEGAHWGQKRLNKVNYEFLAEECSCYEKETDGYLGDFNGPRRDLLWDQANRQAGVAGAEDVPPSTVSLVSALGFVRSPAATCFDYVWELPDSGGRFIRPLLAKAALSAGFSSEYIPMGFDLPKKLAKEFFISSLFSPIDPDASPEQTQKITERRGKIVDTSFLLFPGFIRFVSFLSSVVMMNNYCKKKWREYLIANRVTLTKLLRYYEKAKSERNRENIEKVEKKLEVFVSRGYKSVRSFKGVMSWIWSNVKGAAIGVGAIGATALGLGLVHRYVNSDSDN